jgi:hypothetical protein
LSRDVLRLSITSKPSRLAALLLAVVSVVVVSTATTAHAQTQVAILCRGAKYNLGATFKTYSAGGYGGNNCGAGIDYVSTPTGGSTAGYFFGHAWQTAGNPTYYVQAWIPTYYASAVMNFDIYQGNYRMTSTVINQLHVSGWVNIGTTTGGYDVTVWAWSGMATPGWYMGLDAIRILK